MGHSGIQVILKGEDHVKILYKGEDVDCYGTADTDFNISICCDNEAYDGIYARGYNTWEECVIDIVDNHPRTFPKPVQVETI